MKDWYKSKTIWAGVLAVASGLAGGIGLTVDPMTGNFSGNVYDIAGKLLPLAGTLGSIAAGAGAIVGRLKAAVPIKPIRKRAR